MDNLWHGMMAALLLASLPLTKGVPRAWWSVGVALLSIIANAVLWNTLDREAVVLGSMISDTLLCLFVAQYGKTVWEFVFSLFFWGSVIVSLFALTGVFTASWMYPVGLGIWDLCIVFTLGLVGVLERSKAYGIDKHRIVSAVYSRLHRPYDSFD